MTDTTTTTPPATKPGYRTTEFYLATAAKLLGILFASGLIGAGTTLERVAGLAATLLAGLGYTVSRAVVKAAALLLVVGLAASTQVACTQGQRDTAVIGATAAIDCMAPAITDAVTELLGVARAAVLNAIAGDGSVDMAALRSAARGLKSDAPRCALASVIAALAKGTKPAPGAPAAAPLVVDSVELAAAFARIRADWGGASYRTAAGVL